MLDEHLQRSGTGQTERAKPHIRILAAAAMVHRSNSKAAAFLNQDCNRNAGPGLTRDHVLRASKRFDRALLALPSRRFAELEMRSVVYQFMALVVVYRAARKHAGFKHLRGAELALAIHERDDLFAKMDKAYAIIEPRAA